jgi:hypothetical protein
MSKAACKLLLCSGRANAEVETSQGLATLAGKDLQTTLDAICTPAEQATLITALEQVISVFQQVNAKLML